MFQELTLRTAAFTWHSSKPQSPNPNTRVVFAVPAAAGAAFLTREKIGGYVFANLRDFFSLEKQLRQRAQRGAGLAVRQRMYAKVGGLSPLPYNEDKQLYQKLLQRDACIKMNDRLVVYTSSRMAGRTKWGMAAQLMKWKNAEVSGECILVSSVRAQWLCFQLQHALYVYWLAQSVENLSAVCTCLLECGLPNPRIFLDNIGNLLYFGQYWCCVWEHPKMVEARQAAFSAIPLEEAISHNTLLLTLEKYPESAGSMAMRA